MAKQLKTPDPYMIEYAMEHWFSETCPKKYVYSTTQVKEHVKAGYLVLDREEWHRYPDRPTDDWKAIWYKVTPEGLRWWIEQRAASYLELDSKYINLDPAILLEDVKFKGVGSEWTMYLGCWNVGAVFVALRDGLLRFIDHTDYSGNPRNCNEYMTVGMTSKGAEYFDSLPRLVEVY